MLGERARILRILSKELIKDPCWGPILKKFDALSQLHLAIFNQPYLGFIASGTKTVESRFSKNKIAPFDSVKKGDILLLKESGKPITAICLVEKAWFYLLTPGTLETIQDEFTMAICPADNHFWEQRKECQYCSLIWISNYKSVVEIAISKRDRRGWVILA